MKCTQLEMLPK